MCGGPRDFLAWSTWAQENAYSLERGVVGRGGWEGVRGPRRTQKGLPHLHAPAGHQDSQQEDLGLPAFSCAHQGPLWKAWDAHSCHRMPASAAPNPGSRQQLRPGYFHSYTENLRVGYLVQPLTSQTRKGKATEAE